MTTLSGVISGAGALTEHGFGTAATTGAALMLAGASTFAGGFVNTGLAATASVVHANNNTRSAFGAGAVSIGAASTTVYSTLAGSLHYQRRHEYRGPALAWLPPANLAISRAGVGAIGLANFNTTSPLASTGSLYLEAAGVTNRDQINVDGLFTLNGTVFIAFAGGFVFGSNGTGSIDFVDWSSVAVGTVAFDTSNAVVAPDYTLDTSFFTTDGTIRLNAALEPGTWAAVASGLGVLGELQFARRRRQV